MAGTPVMPEPSLAGMKDGGCSLDDGALWKGLAAAVLRELSLEIFRALRTRAALDSCLCQPIETGRRDGHTHPSLTLLHLANRQEQK